MNQDKQKEHTERYFDARRLKEYVRKDVSFTVKLLERQAGKHYFEEKYKDDTEKDKGA